MARRRGGATPSPADPTPDAREAVAFPGQGVDAIDLADTLEAHGDDPLVARLGVLLGTSAWRELDLADTRVAQPCVFTASVVRARAAGLDPATTSVAFGHSLGELSACAFAGVVAPMDGLDLVVRRAELCHAEHERRPGRMAVVMRLDLPAVEWVRRGVVAEEGSGILELAVVNGPGQFVLSGDAGAVEVALDRIADAGGVGRLLPIGGGYHSPLMRGAVEPLAAAIEALRPRDPATPIVSCTTQQIAREAHDVVAMLARALVLPVRWTETMQAVRDLGVDRAVDVGPSPTLANLAKFAPVLAFRTLDDDRPAPPP